MIGTRAWPPDCLLRHECVAHWGAIPQLTTSIFKNSPKCWAGSHFVRGKNYMSMISQEADF